VEENAIDTFTDQLISDIQIFSTFDSCAAISSFSIISLLACTLADQGTLLYCSTKITFPYNSINHEYPYGIPFKTKLANKYVGKMKRILLTAQYSFSNDNEFYTACIFVLKNADCAGLHNVFCKGADLVHINIHCINGRVITLPLLILQK